MAFDRQDWQDSLAAKRKERDDKALANIQREIQMTAKAAVDAEALTGDPHWDVFLQYIQAAIDGAVLERDGLAATHILDVDASWDDESIRHARARMLCCKERIRVLEAILTIPADLKSKAEEVLSLVERLDAPAAA
jgi:hypothetical protein|tara:strand:+ start:5565 stop:5972 length:408 start_codon:yes stop_codon:yes gene_type:complete